MNAIVQGHHLFVLRLLIEQANQRWSIGIIWSQTTDGLNASPVVAQVTYRRTPLVAGTARIAMELDIASGKIDWIGGNMVWSEDCQREIDLQIATHDLSEVITKAVSTIVEGKIDVLLMNLGHMPSCDPSQTIDFGERLLCAALDELQRDKTNS